MSATGSEAVPLGERLRRLREGAGLTQEELAERAGLTAKGVAALERGRVRRPYPHTLRALADALGLSDEARAGFFATAAGPGAPSRGPLGSPGPESNRAPLPTPPTALLGRVDAVAAVMGLLQGGARLVTLTGPGGVGKTQLALAVATGFPARAAFVALAPLADPALVLPAVAAALGLREVGEQPTRETLHSHLRERQTFLVLDNCEHLLAAAPDVAGLLAAAPGLIILATSRAPLRLRGEREYQVAPLAPPDLDDLPATAEIAGNPAVQLFIARAHDVAPGFALTEANAAAVAAICRRLDGLPLAIELAAARVRILSPTEILARLDRALPLLTGGARDLPTRQRTMRDTIAWSYDLLAPAERALFRRLAPFAGSWDLAAAEAVGAEDGDDGGDGEGVLGRLAGLVEQSLVLVEAGGPDGSRYRLLEPVREFAWEELEARGEAEDARRRHAAHYLELAERAGPELAGPAQVTWLDRLDREHDNVRAVMAWTLATGQPEIAARLGWALHVFWDVRGYHREGWRWMEAARAGGRLTPPQEARALVVAGVMARMRGEYEIAISRLEQALATFRLLGEQRGVLVTLHRLGQVSWFRGDYRGARSHAEEGLALAREVGDRERVVTLLEVLGLAALGEGHYRQARVIFEEGLELAQTTGNTRYLAGMHSYLGVVVLGQGRHDEAMALSRAALELCGTLGLRRGIAYNLDTVAALAAAQGQYTRATNLFGAAEALREATGLAPWAPAIRPLYERYLDLLRSQLGEARFAAEWGAGRAMPLEQAIATAMRSAG